MYKIIDSSTVLNTDTHQAIPLVDNNPHAQEYYDWIAGGNLPEPAHTIDESRKLKERALRRDIQALVDSVVPSDLQLAYTIRAMELTMLAVRTPEEQAELDSLNSINAQIRVHRSLQVAKIAEIQSATTQAQLDAISW